MAQHNLTTHPLVVRRVEVARAVDVTPRMRRITLTGPQLGAFHDGEFDLPAFVSPAFDDHVKLVFAVDGDIEAALPVQRARSIDWPPSEHRRGRDYTPRRWDPVAGELDLDFVLHGDGPAAAWAASAKPGDPLHFAGPKSSLVLPDDIDWILLAGDETALPAIGRFLEERPLDVPAQVVVEVRDGSARQELALRDTDTIRWLVTDEHAPSALPSAVRESPWWPGRPYAWAAGESRSLVPLRNWLRRDRELPPSHVNVTGYWHAEPASSEQAAPPVDAEELLSPLPWLATRAAVELGLLDHLGTAPLPLETLAGRLAVDVVHLRPLVTYLATIEVLEAGPAGVTVGRVGEEVLGDDHLRGELFGSGVEARTLQALTHLAPALREGTPAWSRSTGRTLADDVDGDPDLYADRVDAAGSFAFVAAGVADLPAWKAADRVQVTGPGALALVGAVKEPEALRGVVVSAAPVPLRVLTERAGELATPDVPIVPDDRAGTADLLVSTLELRYRTDAELGAHLARLAQHADRVLLVDALRHSGPGGPAMAAEHDLLDLAATGSGPRGAEDVERAARSIGWRLIGHVPLGWDYEAYELGS